MIYRSPPVKLLISHLFVFLQAYFTDGVTPDAKNLISLGQKAGLSAQEIQDVVTNPTRLESAKRKALGWSSQGISGEP